MYSLELLFDKGIRASAQIPRNEEYNGVVDVDGSDHVRKEGMARRNELKVDVEGEQASIELHRRNDSSLADITRFNYTHSPSCVKSRARG